MTATSQLTDKCSHCPDGNSQRTQEISAQERLERVVEGPEVEHLSNRRCQYPIPKLPFFVFVKNRKIVFFDKRDFTCCRKIKPPEKLNHMIAIFAHNKLAK